MNERSIFWAEYSDHQQIVCLDWKNWHGIQYALLLKA